MALGKKTGGRKAGVPNKATAEIKAVAQKHGPAAIRELVRLMTEAESDAARVAAIKELLDRAYGKSAPSPEEREDAKNLIVQITKFSK